MAFTSSQIITGLGAFVLGAGVTLSVQLAEYEGSVYNQSSAVQVEEFATNVQTKLEEILDYANGQLDIAENEKQILIGKINEANNNIDSLIDYYANIETTHQGELDSIQAKINEMMNGANTKYKEDMEAVINEANGEINEATNDALDTNTKINKSLKTGNYVNDIANAQKTGEQIADSYLDDVTTGAGDIEVHGVDHILNGTGGITQPSEPEQPEVIEPNEPSEPSEPNEPVTPEEPEEEEEEVTVSSMVVDTDWTNDNGHYYQMTNGKSYLVNPQGGYEVVGDFENEPITDEALIRDIQLAIQAYHN